MHPQLKISTFQEEASASSPNYIRLGSLVEPLVKNFFETQQPCRTFRSAIAEFDKFFHVDLLDRYSVDDLPRLHLAVHSSDEAIVLDYPDHAGFAPFLKQVLSEIAAQMGCKPEIQMKSVKTIRGSAVRFLINLC